MKIRKCFRKLQLKTSGMLFETKCSSNIAIESLCETLTSSTSDVTHLAELHGDYYYCRGRNVGGELTVRKECPGRGLLVRKFTGCGTLYGKMSAGISGNCSG